MPVPKPLAAAAARSLAFLRAIPLKLTIALVAAASLVGEQFPLSPFPMYSTWAPETYLIYFADKDGIPIPIQERTYYKTSRYRGMFEAHLNKIKNRNKQDRIKPDRLQDFGPDQFHIAGIHILDWIDQSVHPDLVEALAPLRPLQVVHRKIHLVDGHLSHTDTVVATDADRQPAPSAP